MARISLNAIRRLVGGHQPDDTIATYLMYRRHGADQQTIADSLGMTQQAVAKRLTRMADVERSLRVTTVELCDILTAYE